MLGNGEKKYKSGQKRGTTKIHNTPCGYKFWGRKCSSRSNKPIELCRKCEKYLQNRQFEILEILADNSILLQEVDNSYKCDKDPEGQKCPVINNGNAKQLACYGCLGLLSDFSKD